MNKSIKPPKTWVSALVIFITLAVAACGGGTDYVPVNDWADTEIDDASEMRIMCDLVGPLPTTDAYDWIMADADAVPSYDEWAAFMLAVCS